MCLLFLLKKPKALFGPPNTILLAAYLSSPPFHCALPKVGTDFLISVSRVDEQNVRG